MKRWRGDLSSLMIKDTQLSGVCMITLLLFHQFIFAYDHPSEIQILRRGHGVYYDCVELVSSTCSPRTLRPHRSKYCNANTRHCILGLGFVLPPLRWRDLHQPEYLYFCLADFRFSPSTRIIFVRRSPRQPIQGRYVTQSRAEASPFDIGTG